MYRSYIKAANEVLGSAVVVVDPYHFTQSLASTLTPCAAKSANGSSKSCQKKMNVEEMLNDECVRNAKWKK